MPDVPYTLSDMANDCVGLLDALGVDAAHVVGASMGGMIAQTMAIEHPDRVRSLTSIMSSVGDPRSGKPNPRRWRCCSPSHQPSARPTSRALRADAVWASKRYVDVDRIRRRAAESFDRSFYPAGGPRQLAAIYASGDRTAALARRRCPDAGDPWPRRHADHARRRNGDGRGDPRRPPPARRRHGPRPSAGAVAADRLGDRRSSRSVSGPLAGYRIIEIAGIGPGPFAAMLLADMGAEVIRVERAPARARCRRPTRRTSTSRCAVGATSPSTSSIQTASPCCSTSSSAPTPSSRDSGPA